MFGFFQEKGMIATNDDLDQTERLLGHRPPTFDDFVKEITVEWRTKSPKAA
jgi:hypothetical protein